MTKYKITANDVLVSHDNKAWESATRNQLRFLVWEMYHDLEVISQKAKREHIDVG